MSSCLICGKPVGSSKRFVICISCKEKSQVKVRQHVPKKKILIVPEIEVYENDAHHEDEDNFREESFQYQSREW